MEAARALAASLPTNVSDADRAAALRAYEDAVAVLAESCDELPTMTQILEALERTA